MYIGIYSKTFYDPNFSLKPLYFYLLHINCSTTFQNIIQKLEIL